MDPDALAELPLVYAVALRLEEAGAAPRLIAAGLDVPEDTVVGLLDLARRKLERLRGVDGAE